MKLETYEIITKTIAWFTSLGTTGMFIFFLVAKKITKTIIKLLVVLGIIALIFWIISNPNIAKNMLGEFLG